MTTTDAPPPAAPPPAPPSPPPALTLLDTVKARLEEAMPAAKFSIEGTSLVVERDSLFDVSTFLRDDSALKLDFLSNLCAVDWPSKNHLEVVYHLYSTHPSSVGFRAGPLSMKCRTADRADDAKVPSVTPVWRSAEYQEREGFDLYGVIFTGHPDMRRILMWDEFTDFPMRKDYKAPDDYEWEPTPHADVVEKVKELQAHQGKQSTDVDASAAAREGLASPMPSTKEAKA